MARAAALAKKRKEELFKDSPGVLCLPPPGRLSTWAWARWCRLPIGRWEGDSLVVQSSGFNDRTWLDNDGHPHTEALRVTERFRRPDFGHLEVLKTMADPGALMEPWVVPFKYEYDADTEQIEYVCVEVAREILAKYAGSCEFSPPERPELKMSLDIVVEGDIKAVRKK